MITITVCHTVIPIMKQMHRTSYKMAHISGIITSLLVIAISSNKVEGMAIGKLSGGFGMILFIPLIIKGPVQYVFSLFPMFWVGKYIRDELGVELPLALILFIGWIYCLMKKFRKRI